MNDPTDDTLSSFDEFDAIPCLDCGAHTDDPATDSWARDEQRLGWMCPKCAAGESDTKLAPE